MGDLSATISSNLVAVVAALSALILLLVIVVVAQARRVGRLRSRVEGLVRGEDGRSLEGVLDAHLDRVGEVARALDELEARTAVLERDARQSFQRIGLVRFNPFEDTGGTQSFALAVLDAEDDGFVVSSLHARSGARLFAKALRRGLPDAALSDEEVEALRQARGGTARGAGPSGGPEARREAMAGGRDGRS